MRGELCKRLVKESRSTMMKENIPMESLGFMVIGFAESVCILKGFGSALMSCSLGSKHWCIEKEQKDINKLMELVMES